MAVINDIIADWKKGLGMIAYMVLIGILAPLVLVGLFSTAIIIPSMILGFSLDFWTENTEDIAYMAIATLGPYFLGRYWEKI